MRRLKYISACLLILGFYSACTRNADVTRELHYVDLLNPENRAFHKYPDEFSTYLLEGILNDEIAAYEIEYDSSGAISRLDRETLIYRILEPYADYSPNESTVIEEYSAVDAFSLLSSITLLGLDMISTVESREIAYINFYHPGDVTLEGFNKYICSVAFESAIDYLNSRYSPFLWHNYAYEDWGWFQKRLFIPNSQTASKLGHDLIFKAEGSLLAKRITDSLAFQMVHPQIAENPFLLTSKFDPEGEGKLTIAFINDSIMFEIAIFEFADILDLSRSMEIQDSVMIQPVTRAISSNKLIAELKTVDISRNGKFLGSIAGIDELTRNIPSPQTATISEFGASQRFYFRTVERLLGTQPDQLLQLPSILYEGVRKGSIAVYNSDSLKSRLQSGEFFDNMILNDQDGIPANSDDLEIYYVISETIFLENGEIESQKPVGLGLILPGKKVPEGLNRGIGYFRISDINAYLLSIDIEELPLESLKGYPLKSWNIAIYQDN